MMNDTAVFRAAPATPHHSVWDNFALSARRDAAAWLAIMISLSLYRCYLAWPFFGQVGPMDTAAALWTGARFDSVLATIVIIPTLVVGFLACLAGRALSLQKFRMAMLCLFYSVTAVIYGINAEFFRVFGTQIDQRVLGVFDDGDGAVSKTIWEAHHPIQGAALALIFGGLALLLTVALVKQVRPGIPLGWRNRWAQLLIVLIGIALVVGLVRGFAWGKSPIRVQNAYVSQSDMLNRVIPSPYAFWLHAFDGLNLGGTAPSQTELTQALAVQDEAFGRSPGTGLNPAVRLTQIAPGTSVPPKHIFIILMEGQHGFPLLSKFKSWGFYPELSSLAEMGASFDAFIPSGRQTDNTLGALASGTLTPDTVVMMETGAHRLLPTSVSTYFKQLGYDTHFFYGGYAGWQRLDEFVMAQGFQHMHSAADIGGKPGNAWGVWDQYLFDYVLSTVDASKPSFSLILTTNNHSPFSVDEKLLPALPPMPPEAKNWDKDTLQVLRHEIYAQREVSRFVRNASQRFPGSLFVITGDHVAHGPNYSLPHANALDEITVPLIFVGDALPASLRGHHMRPASHLDVAPTLYNLSAPAGFKYSAFGHDLFGAGPPAHALGQDKVLVDGWLADAEGSGLWTLDEPSTAKAPTAAIELAQRHHAAVRVITRAMLHPTLTAGDKVGQSVAQPVQ